MKPGETIKTLFWGEGIIRSTWIDDDGEPMVCVIEMHGNNENHVVYFQSDFDHAQA